MDEVETQLASEDHGKDVTSVTNLLKKHQVSTTQIHILGSIGGIPCYTYL